MGIPKYKNYPTNGDKKAPKSAEERDRLEHAKVLKLQEEIKGLLLNPEKKSLQPASFQVGLTKRVINHRHFT